MVGNFVLWEHIRFCLAINMYVIGNIGNILNVVNLEKIMKRATLFVLPTLTFSVFFHDNMNTFKTNLTNLIMTVILGSIYM